MIAQILIPVAAMAGLGLFFGLGLAYALKLFAIEVDPTVALIISKLPGANCGACGKAGCAAFAEVLVQGKALPSECAAAGEAASRQISEILGIELAAKVKQKARARCRGGRRARDKYLYAGLKTCQAASLVMGGPKECFFGCVGFGDCARTCPFDAIRMGSDGVPLVDRELCVGCGRCTKTCPKGLYVLLPETAAVFVGCASQDKGKKVMEECEVGCISCGRCVKECPAQAITLENNMAVIDYGKCTSCGECVEVCPRHIIEKAGNLKLKVKS